MNTNHSKRKKEEKDTQKYTNTNHSKRKRQQLYESMSTGLLIILLRSHTSDKAVNFIIQTTQIEYVATAAFK